MELNMDTDMDLYDDDGFFSGTDFLSGYDQAGAPTAHSPDIGSSELSNLLNAADASKVSRARCPQQLGQDSDEALPHSHQFNHTFLDDDSCDEADPNDFQFDEADLNNHQFIDDLVDNHQVNVVGLHGRQSVGAIANTEASNTLDDDDQRPNIKRRKTKNTESPNMALAHEHAPSATSAARASLASMSTDRSLRFSASTTRSSILSTSTGRSSIASMNEDIKEVWSPGNHGDIGEGWPAANPPPGDLMPPLTQRSEMSPPDQPSDEGAYKWKCLICHMGEGDSRKAYVRKEGNTPSEQASTGTPDSTTKASLGRAPPKPKNSWKSRALLEKHIRETHLFMFQRTISTEYICIFCLCGQITQQHCRSRFLDKEALLKHVSLAHHEIPSLRVRYDHHCFPLNSSSYHQQLVDGLTRRDGPASD